MFLQDAFFMADIWTCYNRKAQGLLTISLPMPGYGHDSVTLTQREQKQDTEAVTVEFSQ